MPSLELHGLQADNSSCQFFGEPYFPVLFGYGHQFLYVRKVGVYQFQPIVVFCDFLPVAPVNSVYFVTVTVFHFLSAPFVWLAPAFADSQCSVSNFHSPLPAS